MNICKDKIRELPVRDTVDVLVVGSTLSGVAAAIAAARQGAKAALVDRYAVLGGYLTSGGHPVMESAFFHDGEKCLGGLPYEIMDRVAQMGGVLQSNLKKASESSDRFLVDPEILNLTLIEMCDESGVTLHMLTIFCDAIQENGQIKGAILQSKAGRYVVMAKTVIDATENGKLSVSAGVGYQDGMDTSCPDRFGLTGRIGNVNTEKFMEYLAHLDLNADEAEFLSWLEKKTGLTADALREDPYYGIFLAPVSQDWLYGLLKRYEKEKRFFGISPCMLRNVLKKADEAGELDFEPSKQDITIRFNREGLSGAAWRHGEVLANLVCTKEPFAEDDSAHQSAVERLARRQTLNISRAFKKYVPGFEHSYLIKMGERTVSPFVRYINKKAGLTAEQVNAGASRDDAIFMAQIGGKTVQVPLALLCADQFSNLLTIEDCAGRCSELRAAPYMAAFGQGAGVAAAAAARSGCAVADITGETLRKSLSDQGVILNR